MTSPVPVPVHVVVIEDSLPDVMLVREALNERRIPYTLTHYRDGAEALAALVNSEEPPQPDIIMLDLNMPRMGGLELLGQLRRSSRQKSVPVAVLTSSLQTEERDAAIRLGADRFVRKPVDLYEFLHQVGETVVDLVGRRAESQ